VSQYTVKSILNGNTVQTGAQFARGREGHVLRGAADFSRRRVFVMSAEDVCAICEFSAVRIGARRNRELGHEGERISRMAMRVARRVGAEACEANN